MTENQILAEMRKIRSLQNKRYITKANANERMHELNKQLWTLKGLK